MNPDLRDRLRALTVEETGDELHRLMVAIWGENTKALLIERLGDWTDAAPRTVETWLSGQRRAPLPVMLLLSQWAEGSPADRERDTRAVVEGLRQATEALQRILERN